MPEVLGSDHCPVSINTGLNLAAANYIASQTTLRHRSRMKILVRNLARTTSESTINTLFTKFGAVASCDLVLDKETKLSKGFAFVEMPQEPEALDAIKNLNKSTLDDNVIRVKPAE